MMIRIQLKKKKHSRGAQYEDELVDGKPLVVK
jgi:hypothetical protein